MSRAPKSRQVVEGIPGVSAVRQRGERALGGEVTAAPPHMVVVGEVMILAPSVQAARERLAVALAQTPGVGQLSVRAVDNTDGIPLTVPHAAALLRPLLAKGWPVNGRYCYACYSDLSPEGSPPVVGKGDPQEESMSRSEDYKAYAMGGHKADCVAVPVLRWILGDVKIKGAV